MNYVDTSVIVPALSVRHPLHPACIALLTKTAVTSTHALAESFAVLTGIFKFPNYVKSSVVAQALLTLADSIAIAEISRDDYLRVLAGARKKGIVGGLVYDIVQPA